MIISSTNLHNHHPKPEYLVVGSSLDYGNQASFRLLAKSILAQQIVELMEERNILGDGFATKVQYKKPKSFL